MSKFDFVRDSKPFEIRVFETYCKLPDGTIGQVCKKQVDDNWLVCNEKG